MIIIIIIKALDSLENVDIKSKLKQMRYKKGTKKRERDNTSLKTFSAFS